MQDSKNNSIQCPIILVCLAFTSLTSKNTQQGPCLFQSLGSSPELPIMSGTHTQGLGPGLTTVLHSLILSKSFNFSGLEFPHLRFIRLLSCSNYKRYLIPPIITPLLPSLNFMKVHFEDQSLLNINTFTWLNLSHFFDHVLCATYCCKM